MFTAYSIDDEALDDGHSYTPKAIFSYLTRLMYHRYVGIVCGCVQCVSIHVCRWVWVYVCFVCIHVMHASMCVCTCDKYIGSLMYDLNLILLIVFPISDCICNSTYLRKFMLSEILC